MKKVELLAPAGDLSKLKVAIDYGADAVYLGGSAFGLRKASKNFSPEDMEEGVNYAHERGRKVYVTLNIVPHDEDMVGLEDYVRYLDSINVDGAIVTDPGIFTVVKEHSKIPIHMSTQGSLTNAGALKFWRDLGAERAVLARELSLDEIAKIHRELGGSLELEVFVHGAMCISYSGRCLLSNYMSGRDANQGDCAQACRWKYHLVEEHRPGEYYPIVEDGEGTFIMNSKDLNMIGHIAPLIESGVSSLKIEGRVKSEYYLATVIGAYRGAIDAYYAQPENFKTPEKYALELEKVSHRDFTTGFYYGDAKGGEVYGEGTYKRSFDFVGRVLDYDPKTQRATIEQRNRLFTGDVVEIMGPGRDFFTQKIRDMRDENGEVMEVANRVQQHFTIPVDQPVMANDFLRREIEVEE